MSSLIPDEMMDELRRSVDFNHRVHLPIQPEDGPEMRRVKERINGCGFHVSLGSKPATDEEIALAINRSLDEIENGGCETTVY